MITDSSTPLTGLLPQHLRGDFLSLFIIKGEVIVVTIAHIGKSILSVEDDDRS